MFLKLLLQESLLIIQERRKLHCLRVGFEAQALHLPLKFSSTGDEGPPAALERALLGSKKGTESQGAWADASQSGQLPNKRLVEYDLKE